MVYQINKINNNVNFTWWTTDLRIFIINNSFSYWSIWSRLSWQSIWSHMLEQSIWSHFINKNCQDWSESCKNRHDDLELDHFGHCGHLGSGKVVPVSEKISVMKVVNIDLKVVKIAMTTSNSITSATPDTLDRESGTSERKISVIIVVNIDLKLKVVKIAMATLNSITLATTDT